MTPADDQGKRRWLVKWALFEGQAARPLRLGKPKPSQSCRKSFETREKAENLVTALRASFSGDQIAFWIIDLDAKRARKNQPPKITVSFATNWPIHRRPNKGRSRK